MKRTFQRSSRMWVTLALALVAAAALLPGSWRPAIAQTGGEPSPTTTIATTTTTTTTTSTATFTAPPAATSVTLPTTGGTVTVPNAGLTLNFGQGALGANTKVDFAPLVSAPVVSTSTTTQPTLLQQTQAAQQTNTTAVQMLEARGVPPPPGVSVGGSAGGSVIQSLFQLDATNTTNNSNVSTFNAPVILAIVVPPGTLSLAGGNLANVQVLRFNETTRVWIQVACAAGAGGLSCSTSGFSIWAMVVVIPTAAGPGQQAPPVAPRPAATGTGVAEDSMSLLPMMALVLVAGSLAGAGAYAVQRRHS